MSLNVPNNNFPLESQHGQVICFNTEQQLKSSSAFWCIGRGADARAFHTLAALSPSEPCLRLGVEGLHSLQHGGSRLHRDIIPGPVGVGSK